ncbi:pyruvate dehydrogenase E1 component subunit alpha [Spirochaetia bacterium]|nr:pyruvate dehydrogenase E1 component subunit alpha [Spirochaetia bacterium]
MKITDTIQYDKNILPDKSTMLELYRSMLVIRRTEEKTAELLREERIPLFCHLYTGQEAIAAGVCACLQKTDAVFSNHRSHGHYLAKGGSLNAFMAELFGKSGGCSGGHGGSLHLCDPSNGLYGSSGIVAGNMAIGLGPAFAAKLRQTDTISVIFHGDTVPDEGVWHESLNLAALYKLPVLYILENNFYSVYLPIEERRKKNNFIELAAAHGLHSEEVDGNNVLSVYQKTQEAVMRIRNGEEPQFIECLTYRWMDHFGYLDGLEKGWRSAKELEFWKKRCPVKSFKEFLVAIGAATENDIIKIDDGINGKIEEALRFAMNSAFPVV